MWFLRTTWPCLVTFYEVVNQLVKSTASRCQVKSGSGCSCRRCLITREGRQIQNVNQDQSQRQALGQAMCKQLGKGNMQKYMNQVAKQSQNQNINTWTKVLVKSYRTHWVFTSQGVSVWSLYLYVLCIMWNRCAQSVIGWLWTVRIVVHGSDVYRPWCALGSGVWSGFRGRRDT